MRTPVKTFLAASILVATASLAQAGNGTWTNTTTGGLWSATTNWSDTSVPADGVGDVADGAGFTADFSTLNITAANTVTLDGNHTLGTLKFADTTTPFVSWTISSTSGRTITMNNTGGVGNASVDVASNSSVVFGNASAAMTFDTGSTSFDKTGAGSMTVENGGTWAGSAAVTVKGGGVILKQFSTTFTGNYQVDAGTTLQIGNGSGGGALFAGSVAANSKTIALNGGTFKTARSNGTFTLNQNINGIAAGSLVSINNNSNQNFTQDAGSVISGTTGFTMATGGTAIATLNGANTYTGVTTVTAGTLAVSSTGAIRVGNAGLNTAAAGIFDVAGKLTLAASNATIVNNGTFKLEIGSILDLGGLFDTFNGGATGTYALFSTLGTIDTSVASTFSSITGFNSSVWSSVTFNSGNGQLAFTAVPEPGALSALLGGTGVLLGLRRRRA